MKANGQDAAAYYEMYGAGREQQQVARPAEQLVIHGETGEDGTLKLLGAEVPVMLFSSWPFILLVVFLTCAALLGLWIKYWPRGGGE